MDSDKLNSDYIFAGIKKLLKDSNKEGSDQCIQRLVESIEHLPDIKQNGNLNNNSSDEHVSTDNSNFQKIYQKYVNRKYPFLHVLFAFSIGATFGFLIRNSGNFSFPKKLTFEENVFQKFGPNAAPPIRYLHNHLTTDNPNAPVKIFVAAENFNDIIIFNQQISEVFKEFNVLPSMINVTSEMSSANLFNKFKDLTFETEKPLIIINNVNKLKGLAPLIIQRIIDPDTAPSKNATLILTASGIKFPPKMETKKQCEIFVRKYLLDTWSSDDLSEEQTEPVISRCAGIVICLPLKKLREL